MHRGIHRGLLALLLMLAAAVQAANIEVRGLFAGGAILDVDGKQRLLKNGQRSPEGILLIKADKKRAIIEVDGQRHELGMSRRISSSYKAADKAVVRLQSSHGGHYVTPARINGRPVRVMVDTGATTVAMSSPQAQALGIDYQSGQPVRISTANGYTTGYRVTLSSVSIGTVKVHNVEATVSSGNFPDIILLGNSYLGKVDMRREKGVLVLEANL